MSVPLRYRDPTLQRLLVNSYACGQMSLLVRRRMQRLLRLLPELEQQLLDTEARLQVMHDQTPELQPAPEVWQSIEQRLGWRGGTSESGTVARAGLWRMLSVGLSFCLVLVVAVIFSQTSPQSEYVPISYVGVLESEGQPSRLIAAIHQADNDPQSGWVLTAHLTQSWQELPGDNQLWLVDSDGQRQSVGVVRNTDTQQYALSDAQLAFAKNAVRMELTSATEQTVLLAGQCHILKRWSDGSDL
ncbi:MAG: anti-sigma factor [Amphritea sp.]|nr:anti-sigma factor [Amphritea sp.]